MQYSPKLKKAMAEIDAIIKKYDIAAHVVLHTPGHSEYLMQISPSYSCAKIEGDCIRFRAKVSDFNGNVNLRNEKIRDTANMMRLLSDTMGKNTISLLKVADQFDKIVDAQHGDDENHTSHVTQNN